MLSNSIAGDSSVWCNISVTRPMSSCQEAPSTRRSSPMASTRSSHSRVSRCRVRACVCAIVKSPSANSAHPPALGRNSAAANRWVMADRPLFGRDGLRVVEHEHTALANLFLDEDPDLVQELQELRVTFHMQVPRPRDV